MAVNTGLHCGRSDRLPMSTYSRIPLLSDARTQLEPMVCSTVTMMPSAISSREALLRALPKREAVTF